MDAQLITELLSWVALPNLNEKVTAQNVSNLLVCLYVISYMFNRKAVFLIAFFIAEMTSLSLDVSTGNGWRIFFFNSLFYMGLFWWLVLDNYKYKTVVPCGIMFIFQGWMVIDEETSKGAFTFVYVHYEYITLAIHLCIIGSLVRWQALRLFMGEGFKCVRYIFHNSYSYTVF